MDRSWVIGSREDCDVVVNLPAVSGRHCRLWVEGQEIFLEDLKSTNATYVNGSRLSPWTRVSVKPSDRVTLGQVIPLPWPPEILALNSPSYAQPDILSIPAIPFVGTSMVIGRAVECDYPLDLPMVSSRHARVLRTDGQIFIEDLSSSNGTFVNGVRIAQATPIGPRDRVGFGSYTVRIVSEATNVGEQTIAPGSSSVTEGAALPQAPTTTVAPVSTMPNREEDVDAFTRIGCSPARLLTLLGQAPCMGLLILSILKGGARGAASPLPTIAAALSWLAIAALWLGMTSALAGRGVGWKSPGGQTPRFWPPLLVRLAVFAGLSLIQATLVLLAVWVGLDLKGSLPRMLGLLLVATGIGFAFGHLLIKLTTRPSFAWFILPFVLSGLWLFGGQAWRFPEMGRWPKLVANGLPSRWAFEGLLLLESERWGLAENESVSLTSRAPATLLPPAADLAEPYFPAESDRMGEQADVLALSAMFVGWMASSAFIGGNVRKGTRAVSREL